jgi:hypothetical protein
LLDIEVFKEVLEPLVVVAIPKVDVPSFVHNFDLDFHVKMCSKRIFGYE